MQRLEHVCDDNLLGPQRDTREDGDAGKQTSHAVSEGLGGDEGEDGDAGVHLVVAAGRVLVKIRYKMASLWPGHPLEEILHTDDLDGDGATSSGTAADDNRRMLLDVEGARVEVAEQAAAGDHLGHGQAEKVGEDQQERLRDVDGLRLEVVQLGEDRTKAGKSETKNVEAEREDRQVGVVVRRQDLDGDIVVVFDTRFLSGRSSEMQRLVVENDTTTHLLGRGARLDAVLKLLDSLVVLNGTLIDIKHVGSGRAVPVRLLLVVVIKLIEGHLVGRRQDRNDILAVHVGRGSSKCWRLDQAPRDTTTPGI